MKQEGPREHLFGFEEEEIGIKEAYLQKATETVINI